jgi:hypothetical protein
MKNKEKLKIDKIRKSITEQGSMIRKLYESDPKFKEHESTVNEAMEHF